jgi:hypothetical protein
MRKKNKIRVIPTMLGCALLSVLCPLIACLSVVYDLKSPQSILLGYYITDPEQVAAQAKEFPNFTLPQGYKEKIVSPVLVIKWLELSIENESVPSSDNTRIDLFKSSFFDIGIKEYQKLMIDDIEKMRKDGRSHMLFVGTQKVTIHHQEVTFSVYEGKHVGEKVLRRWISQPFSTTRGLLVVSIWDEVDHWDQKTVDEFLQSIN